MLLLQKGKIGMINTTKKFKSLEFKEKNEKTGVKEALSPKFRGFSSDG